MLTMVKIGRGLAALGACALALGGLRAQQHSGARRPATAGLATFEFSPAAFQHPALEYGPFTRWWWPGNDVTPDELRREINLFADFHFGGVEIQPLALVAMNGKEQIRRIMSWDTPGYYEHVRVALDAARARGLTVDMTNGSGWPSGGPHLTAEDNLLTLRYATLVVAGGHPVRVPVPRASTAPTSLPMFGTSFYGKVDPSLSRLQAVVATRVVGSPLAEQVQLDPTATIDLTDKVVDNQLAWDAPAGNRTLIAFWAMPDGEKPSIIATSPSGFVVDHFDSTKVVKNYEHLFGERTGLGPYFGQPLRAVFNDSYEFKAERHYSHDFLRFFAQQRGYSAVPWLAANMHPGYSNLYYHLSKPDAKTNFTFSAEDWRLRYDYDLTLSDLLQAHFLKPSRHWLESRGLLHSTQAYGLNMDQLAAAGLASIPETEQLAGNSEGGLKLVTSGAHLYNRPVTAAEAVVYIDRAYMTSPQKIKLSADKAFAAGVNQLIYHGTPYRYLTDKTGPEGWAPFSSPVFGTNFSGNYGEGNNFWANFKPLNEYVQRTQYALRAGKPHADVLVYLPFLDPEGLAPNPAEILTYGYVPGVEPSLPSNQEVKKGPVADWSRQVWPLLNQLMAAGLTWEWVNDASLQVAQLGADKQLSIRGNSYQALLLPHVPYMQLGTAQHLRTLGLAGAKLLAVGELPTKQPSFLNYAANDQLTRQQLEAAFAGPAARRLAPAASLAEWLGQLRQPVQVAAAYPFLRRVQREMADGSRVEFFWNTSDQWQPISLTLDARYQHSYWLNAETGAITGTQGATASYVLPPYGSMLLYAATTATVPDKELSKLAPTAYQARPVATLPTWTIKAGDVTLPNSPLVDWKTTAQLRYMGEPGVYTSSFTLAKKKRGAHYFLDLGQVYFTAQVQLNGRPAGQRLYAPYQLDITPFVRKGANQVEVRVTPTQLNGFIGKSLAQDKRYAQFKKKGDTLMSEGLVGPVTVTVQERPR